MGKIKTNNLVMQQSSKIYSVEIDGDNYEVIVTDDDNVPVSVSNGTKSFKFRVKSNSQSKNLLVSRGDNQLPVMIVKIENDMNVYLGCRHLKAVVKTERDLLLETYHTITLDDAKHRHIESPLPGLVTKIQVKTGSKIKKGESIVIIEAMKMENEIRAPHNCTVKKINVREGQAIDKGHIIAQIE